MSSPKYIFSNENHRFSFRLTGNTLGLGFAQRLPTPTPLLVVLRSKVYVLPHLDMPNLSILIKSYVIKILIDSVTATGVEFTHGGATYTIGANKEVIVSAGALKSLQILELSGIGDPKVLKPLGIVLKVDLPSVGTNMQDHAADISVSWEVTPESGINSLNKLGDPEFLQQKLGAYFSQKRSLLANVVSERQLPLPSTRHRQSEGHHRETRKGFGRNPPKSAALKKQYTIQMARLKNPDMPVFEIIVNPVLTEWIMLNLARDPTTYPALDANYFDHQIDLDIMVEAFKFGRDLANHEPLKKVVAREANPGPNVGTEADIISMYDPLLLHTFLKSIPSLSEHIKDNLCTVWHTSDTLPMLPEEDGGVVDPKLRVYGTSNIRVVDISIIPLQLSIHTQTIAYGIAEKTADIILEKA
ncbi:GMC oxidoreductase [Sphaerobolus stellatus SS14]|uniref:GMC oxidoreductase n=1 Tax=Sphaerobolus stellatus (strain SS14) TaxID=990650 RepID=A0A0C9U2R3_SPHS4|nr:GMC oxidoreductase [Sphaerobolus stellatus SS14]